MRLAYWPDMFFVGLSLDQKSSSFAIMFRWKMRQSSLVLSVYTRCWNWGHRIFHLNMKNSHNVFARMRYDFMILFATIIVVFIEI